MKAKQNRSKQKLSTSRGIADTMLETKWDKIDLFGLCGKGNLAQERICKVSMERQSSLEICGYLLHRV